MTPAQVGIVGVVLGVVVTYASLAVRWTASGWQWYASLPRPAWQPPDAVFGVIWPFSFAALVVAGVTVALQGLREQALTWAALLTLSAPGA